MSALPLPVTSLGIGVFAALLLRGKPRFFGGNCLTINLKLGGHHCEEERGRISIVNMGQSVHQPDVFVIFGPQSFFHASSRLPFHSK